MEIALPPYGVVRGEPRGWNSKQGEFHCNSAAFKLFLGGVGSGKSHAGARELVLGALENGPGGLYVVGAPSHSILEDATFAHYTRFLDEIAAFNGIRLDTKRLNSPQNRRIVLQGGITIRFISLHKPDNFAGPTISGFHVDEAALLSDGMSAHNMLLERLRDTRAKRLFGVYTTTPRGPVGIVQHFRQMRPDLEGKPGPVNHDYHYVVSKTEDNAHNLTSGYIDRQMTGKSERQVRQQLNAEIVDFDGAVYSGEFDGVRSLAIGWDSKRDLRERAIYLAIDWGPTYPHVLWIAHDANNDFDVVFGEYCEDRVGHRELLERAMKIGKERWGLVKKSYEGVYCDVNPSQAVSTARTFFGDRDARSRIPVSARVVKGTRDLLTGVDTVSYRLRDHSGKRRLLFAPELQMTKSPRGILQCMRLYQWAQRRGMGQVLYDDLRPLKNGFDHGADALRYYCWRRYEWRQAGDAWTAA